MAGGIRKGLEELKQPSLGLEHEREKEYLHNFTVRAFTWESRPEELDALNQYSATKTRIYFILQLAYFKAKYKFSNCCL